MKIHRYLIIRSFRGMAGTSSRGPTFCNSLRQNQPISALVNPQIARFCFSPIIPNTFTFSSATATTDSAQRWPKEPRTVCSAAGKRVFKGNNEYNEDDSLRGNAKYPRPEEVPWQKELANRVQLIGVIHQPVLFKYTQTGKAFAWTGLEIATSKSEKIMRFPLLFFGELAETAAEHLKQNDRVCVLGHFTSWGTNETNGKYKVVGHTLNFVENKSPYFPQQVVVDKNTPSRALPGQAIINRDTPLQYKKSTVKSSSSGQNVQESSTKVERLWQAFFANPFLWWDNRTNKKNPKYPDFKHKNTGEALWISSTNGPSWVRSLLAVLDSKVLEQGEGRSSRRSRGSLSSFNISGL